MIWKNNILNIIEKLTKPLLEFPHIENKNKLLIRIFDKWYFYWFNQSLWYCRPQHSSTWNEQYIIDV